ncbi:hypothetical protein ABT160_25905 [Streptomyces sp. NPDC001941]|uniref:hypothetical protein n=1 Tax=Streptomyces sp. NPDC001941 TaxID=3154659 RepID=UPI003331D88C
MTSRRTTKRRSPAPTQAPTAGDPLAAARTEAEALLAVARAEADGVRADARAVAEDLVADADRQAAELRKDAAADLDLVQGELADAVGRRAQAVRDLDRARSAAAAIRTEAEDFSAARRAFADRVHHDAIDAATTIRTAADRDAERVREAGAAVARRLREQADADAVRLRDDADRVTAQADQARRDAEQEAARTVADGQRRAKLTRYDADVLRHQADAELARARRLREAAEDGRRGQLTAWLWGKAPWAALCAAVGLTASGEFELARLVGWPNLVAPLLPVTIDVWAVTAFHRGRDVKAALAVMIGTNTVYHLAERGMFGVDGAGRPAWWLIILTASIAPIVVWRVHQLIGAGRERTPSAPDADRTPSAAVAEAPTAPAPVAPAHRKASSPTATRRRTPAQKPSGTHPQKPSASQTTASDADLIAVARARLAEGHEPSATWLMNTHGVGAKRAARIRDAAKTPTLAPTLEGKSAP